MQQKFATVGKTFQDNKKKLNSFVKKKKNQAKTKMLICKTKSKGFEVAERLHRDIC